LIYIMCSSSSRHCYYN